MATNCLVYSHVQVSMHPHFLGWLSLVYAGVQGANSQDVIS